MDWIGLNEVIVMYMEVSDGYSWFVQIESVRNGGLVVKVS